MQAVQPHTSQPLSHFAKVRAKRLVVIDDRVTVSPSTLNALDKRAIALSIAPQDNSFQMIALTLRKYAAVDCVHVFAKCQDGMVQLGNVTLDATTIEQYSWDLQDWFSHIYSQVVVKRPQILIHYEPLCNASVEPPVLNALSQLTGAEVILR